MFPKRYGFVVPEGDCPSHLFVLPSAPLIECDSNVSECIGPESGSSLSWICLLVAFPIVLFGFSFEDEGFAL